ncbi:MAG: 4-hydroxy-tetrahydrodipicolinate reductase [Chloroflexi bacterium RBG_16_56_11]|nr:MAG: 4-hydroxy-tetrahydrodipicolinate reductase [Chloroflexi bacterium RBG_16_56_11]
MERIRIIVHGAAGRVGQEVVKAVCQEPDMQLVGAVDIRVTLDPLSLPDGAGTVPFSTDFANAIDSCQPDVVVDFTVAKASLPAVRIAAKNGVNMVIGTTGFSAQDLDEMKKLAEANEVGIVAASNFALGAVLMIHLAKIAGKFMDHVEIIELHHDRKLDAPSGTSVSTARAMLSARGRSFLPPAVPGEASESRGKILDGIDIHSVRLPGLMAHQEVLFGAPGQTLSIRHDTINRECYMPGVMLAVREVVKKPGFIYGLDTLLGL